MLLFRCPCGAEFADLGRFHDHALPCHQRRTTGRQSPGDAAAKNRAEEERRKTRERVAAMRRPPAPQQEASPPPAPLLPPRPPSIPEEQRAWVKEQRRLARRHALGLPTEISA